MCDRDSVAVRPGDLAVARTLADGLRLFGR
jgi:hypothetical protein